MLPHPARLVNNAMMWGLAQLFGERWSAGDDTIVSGTAASAGCYTGTVRVVMGERDFGKIRPGDVVVCPVTSPAWSVVFPSMGALVTDMGGILSHPAIIAREHRIPAVVGTGNATDMLQRQSARHRRRRHGHGHADTGSCRFEQLPGGDRSRCPPGMSPEDSTLKQQIDRQPCPGGTSV